jgi:predicted nucleic acid-binding protein
MILLDTNVLIALVDARDQWHSAARAHLRRLRDNRLLTTTSVLAETAHCLTHRSARARLRALLELLEVEPCPIPDERLHWADTLSWCERYADHEPDWVDAQLAVLCGHDRRYKVWTYDREFSTLWRRPDGSRIPLAVR